MTEKEILRKQKKFFAAGQTRSVVFRRQALQRLRMEMHKQEKELFAALKEDLGKSQAEAYMTELGLVYDEIAYACRHLKQWSRRKRRQTAMLLLPGKCYEYREPYGSVLILAPWNYPLLLCLVPLIGALAAGNCAVVKPSELAGATSAALENLIRQCFPQEYVAVVQGDREVSTRLLQEPFDFIFYTGGERVGKIVMEAAARHLTPVCLELGGKSPCIVDDTANIKLAARRIVYGKLVNAGQTCVAPDYLFVHARVKEQLIAYMIHDIRRFLGDQPLLSEKYPSIINAAHTRRLMGLLEGEKILYGGKQKGNRIEPTLVEPSALDTPIMQEEIFGPLLPVFTYEDLDEVLEFISERPKPLALYFFSEDKQTQKRVLEEVSFGGGCINDTLLHVASHHLRFGGVGSSGMGSYHGKYSFDLFSHKKSILQQSTCVDLPLRYHPCYGLALALLKRIMK